MPQFLQGITRNMNAVMIPGIHCSERWRQGKKDQQPGLNPEPTLYHRASATRKVKYEAGLLNKWLSRFTAEARHEMAHLITPRRFRHSWHGVALTRSCDSSARASKLSVESYPCFNELHNVIDNQCRQLQGQRIGIQTK